MHVKFPIVNKKRKPTDQSIDVMNYLVLTSSAYLICATENHI